MIGHREFDLKLTQRVKMSMVMIDPLTVSFCLSILFIGWRPRNVFQFLGR